MSRTFLCALCRHRLLKTSARTGIQWLHTTPQAPFDDLDTAEESSTTIRKYREGKSITLSRLNSSARQHTDGEQSRIKQDDLFSLDRLFPPNALHNGQLLGRYSRALLARSTPKASKKSVIKTENKSTPARPSDAKGKNIGLDSNRRHQTLQHDQYREDDRQSFSVEHLETLLRHGEKLEEAWRYLSEAAKADSSQIARPRSLQDLARVPRASTFALLLREMIKRWEHSILSGSSKGKVDIVTPCEVYELYSQIGIWRQSHLDLAISMHLTAIFSQLSKPDSTGHQLHDIAMSLCEFWKFALPKATLFIEAGQERSGWTAFAVGDPSQYPTSESGLPMLYRLMQTFMPRIVWVRAGDYDGSLLLTFCALANYSDKIGFSKEEYDSVLPFINFAAKAIISSKVEFAKTTAAKALHSMNLPKEFASEMTQSLDRIIHNAGEFLDWNKPEGNQSAYGFDRDSSQRAFISHALKTLGWAVDSNSIESLDGLWKRTTDFFRTPSSDQSIVSVPLALYNAFLTTTLRLRQPGKALEIWNFMVTNGTEPDRATWNAMIIGNAKSKNIKSMEQVWQKMLAAGVKPDTYLWTTRIQGHLNHGDLRHGIKIMDAMGNEYNKTLVSEGEVNAEPYKPTIFTLNAAITAVCRRQHSDLIGKVLQWAATFGIKPDTYTYNAIIHMLIAQNRHGEAQKILTTMELSNVPPDTSTITILLHAAVRTDRFKSLPPDQQTKEVMKVLEDFEARGHYVQKHFFSSIIQTLLNEHRNIAAVKAMLAIMNARSLRPTPQVFTILAEHYFSSDPPDLIAADSLWTEAQQPDSTSDSIFCDRMIRGYARCGEVGKMMTVFMHMSKTGRRPGWDALREAVSALVASGDRRRAADFVSDVMRGEGLLSAGVRQRYLKKNWREKIDRDEMYFWEVVDNFQLA